MKRWKFRILICLVLGAVTTVGVAWTLALAMPYLDWGASRLLHDGTERPRWVVRTARDLGALDIRAGAVAGLTWTEGIDERPVPGWSRAVHPPTTDEVEGATLLIEKARGWPMLSLYRRETNTRASAPDWRTELGWEIELLRRFTKDPHSRTVPLAVIWPGFLINTLLYGALSFGLLFGLGAARRGLRKKRGRCPMCAYDLRGDLDAGCPECGWGREEGEE